MKNKRVLALLVAILVSMPLLSCQGRDIYKGVDAEMVQKIPDGFVLFPNEGDDWRYVIWENVIAFLDADGVCIYQIGINNSEFIVRYDSEYYVNEEKMSEIIDVASISCDVRAKTYSLGETIEIRGEGKTAYFVTVSILDVTEAGDTTTYVIKTYATSNLAGNEHKRFITIVEAENGVSYNAFEFINEETISIKLVRNEKIGAVILGSPDWPGLSYRIVVAK